MSGTASEVGGIVSATSCRKTVKDKRIVTPELTTRSWSLNCVDQITNVRVSFNAEIISLRLMTEVGLNLD